MEVKNNMADPVKAEPLGRFKVVVDISTEHQKMLSMIISKIGKSKREIVERGIEAVYNAEYPPQVKKK
jgi:folylpolyglutamate synthase/dihydropteroate synthase